MANRSSPQQQPAWRRRDWLWGLVLLGAVILAYSPVWWAGFIWDDDAHVITNPCVIGPLGLKEIWTTSAARICPLVLTTFWVEHALWGLRPLPYHLVNVVLHGLSAVVLWRVLRILRVPGAWLGAALWALHPVQVETVAWITELKNTQSCLFYLLSILFFARWLRASGERMGREWYYALTLLFAALAMASKSSTVVLPLVLCLCAWWMEGRWRWSYLMRIVPIFFMSVMAGLVSLWTQKLEGANELTAVRTWPERLITAGDVVWFYLGKLAWPHPLIFIYPRWVIHAGDWLSWMPLLVALIVFSVLWMKRETWARPIFVALAYFLVALLPVLGLVDHYFLRYSFVGDHFQYLASMGPLALAAAGVTRLTDILIPEKPRLQSGLCAGFLLTLGLLSWQRTWVYRNDEVLWTDTLARNPTCWMAYTNLGLVLVQKGQVDDAIAQYQKALAINPNDTHARNDLGAAFSQKGRWDEAMEQFNQALKIQPRFADALANRGQLKRIRGDLPGALADLDQAGAIDPQAPLPFFNRGVIRQMQGDLPAALANLRRFHQLAPKDTNADYAVLWIWLIRHQLHQESDANRELSSAMSDHWNASPQDWVSKNAAFLLNRMNETEYFAAAASPDKNKDQSQHCEAWYYAGMKRLLAGDKATALTDFQACLATGQTDFIEYALAQAQINALHSH